MRLRTDARNVRSRAAILRLGARLDGVLRAQEVLRAREMGADGTIRDTAVYSIRDAEWPEVKARLEALRGGAPMSRRAKRPNRRPKCVRFRRGEQGVAATPR